ncbi:MAG: zf-HC2 domain-containing protein [Clostridia bacterium]|nr:zf-HC2 domain-containing protein [Clostridia bacterium]
MKNECNVARDLMPLCIDGVASEESQRLVEEHVKACDECANLFAEMHDELPPMVDEKEHAQLDTAAKKVKQRRRRRVLTAGLLGMVMGILIFLAAANFDELQFRARYVQWNGDLKLDAVYMAVYKQYSGAWSIMCNTVPSGAPYFTDSMNLCYTEDGKGAYLQFRLTYAGREVKDPEAEVISNWIGTWGNCFDEVWSITNYDSPEEEKVPFLWVELLSGNESKVIWRQGDVPKTQSEVQEELAQFGDMIR